MKTKNKLSLIALLAGLTLTGCVMDRYSSPQGGKFTRLAVGNKTSLSSLDVVPQTNAPPELHLRGYQNDQVQALGVVAEGVARGVVSGAKK